MRQRTLTPKIRDVTILWRQRDLTPKNFDAKDSGCHDSLAPKFPEAPSWSAKVSGRRGGGKSALRSIRTSVPAPSPPSPPGEGIGASRGRPPRLPPGFRGQDRAASAPLCPLKPGIGRGRPGRSGRVIPGRNPAGSPGFAWGRRVQGLAFPAGETGPARGVGAPVCPFSERRTFAVWRMGAHPAHGAPDPHPNPQPAPRRASPPPGRSLRQNPAGGLPDPPGF